VVEVQVESLQLGQRSCHLWRKPRHLVELEKQCVQLRELGDADGKFLQLVPSQVKKLEVGHRRERFWKVGDAVLAEPQHSKAVAQNRRKPARKRTEPVFVEV